MKNLFSVKDLMVNVLARGKGAGTAGLFIETPPPQLTPHTPVALVTAMKAQFKHIDKLVLDKNVNSAELDQIALDIGKALIGSRAVAQCSLDMPTCAGNERISPLASRFTEYLERADFDDLVQQVEEVSVGFQQASREINERVLPALRKEVGLD